MKTIKILLVFSIFLTLTSCAITESLIIKDDNKGKLSYEVDMSKMMSFIATAAESKKSKKKKESMFEKDIDSTFSFKDRFANKQDSISKLSIDEQAKIKNMEKFSVRMHISKDQQAMTMSFFTDFINMDELQNVLSPLESMKALKPGGADDKLSAATGGLGTDKSSTKFVFDGKTFKKIITNIKPKEKVEAEEDSEKMKQSLDMIFAQSSFKSVYQFPKAVKSVSIENALYSADRKTITIEFPMKDYMESPEKMGFEVVFE